MSQIPYHVIDPKTRKDWKGEVKPSFFTEDVVVDTNNLIPKEPT